jgi:hypothetical protein
MSDREPDRRDDQDVEELSTSRRDFLSGGGLLAAGVLWPANRSVLGIGFGFGFGDGDKDTQTPLTSEYLARFGEDISAIEQHGHPTFIVSVEDGSSDISSLEDEAKDYEDVRVTRTHTEAGVATVAMPKRHVSAFSELPYVTSVDLNIAATLIEPLYGLRDKDVWTDDDLGSFSWTTRQLLRAEGQSGAPTSGVAFKGEVNPSTPSDVYSTAIDAANHGIDTSKAFIGVIDTGLNVVDEVFGTNATTRVRDASKSFITGETVADKGMTAVADENGHGTFVTSQMAANPTISDYNGYKGLCPNGDLLVAQALDKEGRGSIDDIAAAIRFMADQGVDVFCASLGTLKWSDAAHSALRYAVDRGVVPVIAVGNDRQGSRWPNSPSSSPHGIGVTALTTETSDSASVAYFANTGDHPGTTDLSGGKSSGARPAVGAPGLKVKAATVSSSGSHYIRELSGTSMAAPWVAGVAQLAILSENPSPAEDVTRFDIVSDWLQRYAKRVPKVGQVETGAGMVSLEHIVDRNEPAQTQPEAMTTDAETRGQFYRALSRSQGRSISSWSRSLSGLFGV